MRKERVVINGLWYIIDADTPEVIVNGQFIYATFDAWDELLGEDVKIQYVSSPRNKPILEKPFKIIRENEEECK